LSLTASLSDPLGITEKGNSQTVIDDFVLLVLKKVNKIAHSYIDRKIKDILKAKYNTQKNGNYTEKKLNFTL
jgi:hypothetical protein